MSDLNALANRFNQFQSPMGAPMVNPMNMGAPVMAPVAGEGVTGVAEYRRIRTEAMTRGYVAGYIMANAPAVQMAVERRKSSKGDVTVNIVAKESKPSRCLSVLMALPANCVMRNGTLATPSEIKAGNVDYSTTDKNEMLYQAMPVYAAIAYISALGEKLPEYAPHVAGLREQWSPEDIKEMKGDVSFVTVHATNNRSTTSKDRFRYSLKTTSPRRSLYTRNNIVCLRALEHMSIKCNTEEQAYLLNEAAFGALRYRAPRKDEVENPLQKAMRECATQIWEHDYNVNGEVKKGIASVFFCAGDSYVTESGEKVAKVSPVFYAWDTFGPKKDRTTSPVSQIVKRVYKAPEGDKKPRMATIPVTLKDQPNHKMFEHYTRMIDFIESKGFMSHERLVNMGSSVKGGKAKTKGMSNEARTGLEDFLRKDDIFSEIEAVRNEVTDRLVLSGK